MQKTRRGTEGFDAVALPFQLLVAGTLLVVGAVLLLPILVAIEVRAWIARHNQRKSK